MKGPIHKLLLTVLCLFGINIAYAQEFKKDWSNFSDKLWKINFITNNDKFYGNQSCGAIEFQYNNGDTNIAVIFNVFKKEKWHMNKDTLSKYYMMLNCQGGSAPDFTKGEYYYFPEPCNHCQNNNGTLRRDCAYLYNQLHLRSNN